MVNWVKTLVLFSLFVDTSTVKQKMSQCERDIACSLQRRFPI